MKKVAKVIGTSNAYNRKDNRLEEPKIFFSFDGGIYQTIDWGFGGFMAGDYEGELMPEQEFFIDGIGPSADEVFAVRVDAVVARRLGNQLCVGFVELTSDAYDILEALMMRRAKLLDKFRNR